MKTQGQILLEKMREEISGKGMKTTWILLKGRELLGDQIGVVIHEEEK